MSTSLPPSHPDFSALDRSADGTQAPLTTSPPAWPGQRKWPLLGAVLVLLLLWIALAQWLGEQAHLPLHWVRENQQQLLLHSSPLDTLNAHAGKPIVRISAEGQDLLAPAGELAARSARWLAQDAQRTRFAQQHQALLDLASANSFKGPITLHFIDGSQVAVNPTRPGALQLGLSFYLRAFFALGLSLAALAWLSFHAPHARHALALLTACQALVASLDALLAGAAPLLPQALLTLELPLRQAAELGMAGALLHASCQYLEQQPWSRRLCAAVWLGLVLLAWALTSAALPQAWWWLQAVIWLTALGALAVQLGAQRRQPHPWLALFTRFTVPAVLMWPLLTWAMADSTPWPREAQALQDLAPQLWTACMSALFISLPFMARSQRMAREVVLWTALVLGGMALALAWSMWRLAITGPLAWLGLLVVLALGLVARWWLINRVFERRPIRAAQLFDELYRTIRTVDRQPQKGSEALQALLKNLFQPLRLEPVAQQLSRSLIVRDGTGLMVPVPDLQRSHWSQAQPSHHALLLHGSQAGRRLFVLEDARLADLIVEQIRRGVLFDKAVQQGRSEERLRLAQDLHDDIGARLLTLMYQSTTPEMEDYVRHTLKDLKTLTRGLAASNHSLSFACAEWKADMTHRLSEANCKLRWSASWDHDPELSVVHWSALTRILRELVSNAIAHAHASMVSVELALQQGALSLRVTDNGEGRQPEQWSHGLGLGGIRKRVKQLGGSVHWQEAPEAGIQCSIHVPQLGAERLPLDVTRP